MGVPGLFKFIKQKYPPCVETVDKNKVIPVYDNLYIDFNGIVHYCTHGANDEGCVCTYEVLASRLFVILDNIISFVNPQRSVYIVVDGAVPRTKLNQQRCRRFQSSLRKGNINLPSDATRFDTNCISPGTEFMEMVNSMLKYYIQQRIDSDPAWKKLKVIYSSYRQAKEGEHKIMEYLHSQIKNGLYSDDERNIVYGADADLILLISLLHKKNVDILRDNVNHYTVVQFKEHIVYLFIFTDDSPSSSSIPAFFAMYSS